MTNKPNISASFRDPSGYVFLDEGVIKRHINPIYFNQYNALKEKGVFKKLFNSGLLIKHEELEFNKTYIIIKPEQIPFISYPYEWSFSMYKEAALLTLKIQKFCLDNNFSLKDASAFNVTFHNGKPVFLDTLSFDFYHENKPWRAFKQFVMHFLGPLVLSRYHGSNVLKLMETYIDGIPVNMLASLLPFKTKLSPFLYSNIHLLAKYEEEHNEDYSGQTKTSKLSKNGQLRIIKSLYSYIKGLSLKEQSEWGEYYKKTNYSDEAFKIKANLINNWVSALKVKTLIDVGGNDGTFVRKINSDLTHSIVCDIDNNAVDFNYKTIKTEKESYLLPLVIDLLNPPPSIGFNNKERLSFLKRIKSYNPDITLALALIHHITLSGNIPFKMSAKFFASFSNYLIIEFPKRDDSWVIRLLNTKGEFKAHFNFYNVKQFEASYALYFEILKKENITDSNRIIYLLKAKDVK